MRPTALFSCLLVLTTAVAQVRTAPLVGVVLGPGGTPVADATVTVARGPGRGFACLDLELAHTWLPLDRTRTDGKGRFGLQLPIGLSLRVEVDRAPFARWRSEDVVPGDELRIELQPPCTFRGRLVRADTGAGTTGNLRAWHPQSHLELFRGRTEADGTFVFDRLPAGPFWCDVEPDAAIAPRWLKSFLSAEAPLQHEFGLQPGTTIRGKVVDATTGEPIAGARIGEGWTLHKRVVSGTDGAFELRGYGDPSRPELRCEAVGYLGQQVVAAPGAPPRQQVDFALERGTTVTGSVVDPSGAPRAGVYVATICRTGRETPWIPTRTDAKGRFTCRGVPSGETMLMIRSDGFASVVYALPPADAEQTIRLRPLQLQPAHTVRGILRDAAGKPVPGAAIELQGINGDCEQRAPMPRTWRQLEMYLGTRTTRTDAHGEFAFADVAAGSYGVAIAKGPERAKPQVMVDVENEEELEPIELRQ